MLMSNATAEEKAFFDLLDRFVTEARLRFVLPERTVNVGVSGAPAGEADFVLRITDGAFFQRVVTEGNLGLAESYMAEGWTVEKGTLEGFLLCLMRSRIDEKVRLDPKTALKMGALRAKQMLLGTRANVVSHYDIGEDLYDTFLDETRGYTCGYQKSPDDTLEQLQENKYDRICQKLRLKEGERLYDIGCGYGGLMIHAAKNYGVVARGITNSKAHCDFARRRARELGLEGKVTVDLGDLREARGTYDKVVSVGVLEHQLGHELRAFFDTYARLLADDGLALVHTIGCVAHRNDHDPFIQKYIFPGSTQYPLSVISTQIEKRKLAILDVENMRGHYSPTTAAWLDRFRKNRHTLDPKRYDAPFLRMWEYYLALGVAGARATEGALWQVLFTRNYRRDLPLIRV
jgi:cyclopropane-fatty-acyl-phospholipid synthase